jgi:hypothetical protein
MQLVRVAAVDASATAAPLADAISTGSDVVALLWRCAVSSVKRNECTCHTIDGPDGFVVGRIAGFPGKFRFRAGSSCVSIASSRHFRRISVKGAESDDPCISETTCRESLWKRRVTEAGGSHYSCAGGTCSFCVALARRSTSWGRRLIK